MLFAFIQNSTAITFCVCYTDQNNRVFKFYNGGDGPPRYSVLNFQKVDDDSYTWKEIGSFYREIFFFLLFVYFTVLRHHVACML